MQEMPIIAEDCFQIKFTLEQGRQAMIND